MIITGIVEAVWMILIEISQAHEKNRKLEEEKKKEKLKKEGMSCTKEQYEKKLLQEGGWKCANCNTVNPHYAGTCGCGITKQQSKELIEKRKREAQEYLARAKAKTTEKQTEHAQAGQKVRVKLTKELDEQTNRADAEAKRAEELQQKIDSLQAELDRLKGNVKQ